MLIDDRLPTRPAPVQLFSSWPWPEVRDHLVLVDQLVHQRLAEVQTLWHAGAAVNPATDRSDVPETELTRHLTALVGAGGKRIRPVLAFLGHCAGGGDGQSPEVVTMGAALELLHTFALAQDDVMDGSSIRRGRPTVHRALARLHRERHGVGDPVRYGHNLAILAGDLAHAEAQDLVAELAPSVRSHWRAMVVELVCGQTRDLTGAAWRVADPEGAVVTAQLKSGAYTIQRPLELGALVAGADPVRIAPLSQYGQELGLAFALRDDVLGVWGDPERTGKPSGDDLLEGKPTLIMALASRQLGERPELARVGTPALTDKDVHRLQRMIMDCGIRQEVEDRINGHFTRSLAALERLTSTVPVGQGADDRCLDPVDALATLAHQVTWRDR